MTHIQPHPAAKFRIAGIAIATAVVFSAFALLGLGMADRAEACTATSSGGLNLSKRQVQDLQEGPPRQRQGDRPGLGPGPGQEGHPLGQPDPQQAVHLRWRPRQLQLARLRLLRCRQLRVAWRPLRQQPDGLDRLHELEQAWKGQVDHHLLQPRTHVSRGRRTAVRHRDDAGRRPRLEQEPALNPGQLQRTAPRPVLDPQPSLPQSRRVPAPSGARRR